MGSGTLLGIFTRSRPDPSPAIPIFGSRARATTAFRVEKWRRWARSDVLAGFALGTLTGYYAHSRDNPLILDVQPGGFTVGTHKQF